MIDHRKIDTFYENEFTIVKYLGNNLYLVYGKISKRWIEYSLSYEMHVKEEYKII